MKDSLTTALGIARYHAKQNRTVMLLMPDESWHEGDAELGDLPSLVYIRYQTVSSCTLITLPLDVVITVDIAAESIHPHIFRTILRKSIEPRLIRITGTHLEQKLGEAIWDA